MYTFFIPPLFYRRKLLLADNHLAESVRYMNNSNRYDSSCPTDNCCPIFQQSKEATQRISFSHFPHRTTWKLQAPSLIFLIIHASPRTLWKYCTKIPCPCHTCYMDYCQWQHAERMETEAVDHWPPLANHPPRRICWMTVLPTRNSRPFLGNPPVNRP